ncbi:ribosome-recycling factor [Bacteroidia bacterium]|nr:ribosome-recycling factor [Bacteroidia bacterium]
MIEIKSIIDASGAKMQKAVDFLAEELATIRAGKASPNVLNGVTVEYYGSPMNISQVASITVPDAKTVLIQPWEKGMIPTIEKAILNSNIGLTPSNNGEQIRLTIPALTEERRLQLVKQMKVYAENARVSLRSTRRDAVETLKKAVKDGMPEDMAKDGEDEMQKLTDKFSKKIDELIAVKEKEVMTV